MKDRGWRMDLGVLALVLSGCTAGTNWPTAERVAVPPLPAYPHVLQPPRRTEEQVLFDWPAYVIEFETADPPSDVIQYYKDTLRQMQWRAPFVEHEDVLMIATWDACPIYNLRVDATTLGPLRTKVVLDVSPSLCMDR